MSVQTRIALMVGLIVVLTVGFLLVRGSADQPQQASAEGESEVLVRPDSRVIGERGSSDVVLVEFLDFECEACRAAYPVVESLREKYDGRVTFVARYFPLPGHANAERAARAVESAARQGEFEAMYGLMYQTQTQWGERQEPADDVFRGFAQRIGLDVARFDRDYASPDVASRVQRDLEDGLSLGVRGTPTFFLDGRLLQPESVEGFDAAIRDALADG